MHSCSAIFLCVSAQVLGDALRIKDAPTTQLYQAFEEAGTDLAQVWLHRVQVSLEALNRRMQLGCSSSHNATQHAAPHTCFCI